MEGWTAGLTIAGKSFFATPSGFLQNRDNLLPNWYLLVVEPYPSEKWWSSSMGKMTSHILGKIKMFERIQLNNPCFLLGPPSNPPQECGTLAGRAAKNRSCSEYVHWIWWFSPTFHESLALYLSISLSLSVFLCFFPIWESHIRDILGVHLESCSHNQRQLFEKVLKRARRKNRRKKSGLGSLWISLTCPPDIPQPKK